jgi:hypothetical protein
MIAKVAPPPMFPIIKADNVSGNGMKKGWTHTPSTNEGIGCSDTVLVEKRRGPALARDKGSSKDADEEPQYV